MDVIEDMVATRLDHQCVVCGEIDYRGDEFDLGPDHPTDWLCEKCQSDPYRVV